MPQAPPCLKEKGQRSAPDPARMVKRMTAPKASCCMPQAQAREQAGPASPACTGPAGTHLPPTCRKRLVQGSCQLPWVLGRTWGLGAAQPRAQVISMLQQELGPFLGRLGRLGRLCLWLLWAA